VLRSGVEIEKAQALCPQDRKNLWRSAALERGVSRGKAPRARRISLLFAKGRVRRPYLEAFAQAETSSRASEFILIARRALCSRLHGDSRRGIGAYGRQEVSEPDRVGAKLSARAIVSRGACGVPERVVAIWPLTREDLGCARRSSLRSRGALLRNGAHLTRFARVYRKVGPTFRAGWAKSDDSCLRIAVDGRSRRAARGDWRAGVKSAREAGSSSLVLLRERSGERASEAEPGRQSPGIGGGLASELHAQAGGPAGTRRGKAPWASGLDAFDEASRSRVLAAVTLRRRRREMGRQRSNRTPLSRPTTPCPRGATRGLIRFESLQDRGAPAIAASARACDHSTEARGAPSSATRTESAPRALAREVWSHRASGALSSASLDSSGARVRELVAEIGEDHLP
jgi:hypothetical protein